MSRTIYSYALAQGHLEGTRYWAPWEKNVRIAAKTIKEELAKNVDEGVTVDFSKFTPKNYLLSWATIVGGVEPEKNGFYIVPPHSKWVNDNGNAWLNQVLLESYKSFIWAENYLEHIQIPELSKGKILDAVAWVARDVEPGRREPIPTVFVDILVATNKKKHPKLVEDIKSGRLSGLSMGCNITYSQCSYCGKTFEEGQDEQCEHLQKQLRKYFRGKDGRRHRTAELCGIPGKPGTCEYIEASWVAIPAWKSAVRHDSLRIGDAWTGRPLKAVIPKVRLTQAAREF
jgi:hypothetical protein